MNERLETIMPYYNQLYESEMIKFEPLNDVNLTRKHDRTIDGTEVRNGETSNNADITITTNTNSDGTNRNLYSDTPQGTITNLENEKYLTDARKITDNITSNSSETTNNTQNGTNKINGTSNTTEDYLETLIGKQGSASYSKMLMEFRDTFLNIDMLVIDEFKDLFFGLW